MDRKQHWENIYQTKDPTTVSWFQPDPVLSLQLITEAAPNRADAILDIGGGASTLVDGLLRLGYQHVGVLDLSSAALAHARRRLGADARRAMSWSPPSPKQVRPAVVASTRCATVPRGCMELSGPSFGCSRASKRTT